MKKIFLITNIILLAFSFNVFAQGPPINLSTSNVLATSADLIWDASICPGNVHVQLRQVGSGAWAQGLINNNSVLSSPYNTSNDSILNENTTYEFRVKCNGCAGSSCWSTAVSFTTPACVDGCMDASACNYDASATCDDGSCILPDGCTDPSACNYDPTSLCDDGSCLTAYGCTNPLSCNYDPIANCDDGSCSGTPGCTDATACNYDATATCDDGSCTLPDGCTDLSAINYNSTALCDDGSCVAVGTGPVIDSAFISAPILCNGFYTNDSLQINITQSTTPTTYVCLVGTLPFNFNPNYFSSFYSTTPTTANQINLNGFNPNEDYFIRIVDSIAYYTQNPNGNGDNSAGIYDEYGPINFSEPDLLDTTFIVTDVFCHGDTTGSIDITVTGGTAPYSYLWATSNGGSLGSNLSTDEDLISLIPGDYTCEVTDNNGCQITSNLTIIEPIAPLSVTSAVTHILCHGDSTGFIDITVVDGTAPYSYSWVASNGGSLGGNLTTDEDLFALTAGDYACTITDDNGCQEIYTMTITEPLAPLSATSVVTDILCYGDSSGFIDITVVDGTAPYSFSWAAFNGGNLLANATTDPDLNFVTSGDYVCTIIDDNGCQEIHTTNIQEPINSLNITSVSTDILCYGEASGAINITVSGGTPVYSYLWTANNGGNLGANLSITEDIAALISGDYTCQVTDFNGCLETHTVTIIEPSLITVDPVAKIDISCNGLSDGSATIVNVGGGTPFAGSTYNYLWQDAFLNTVSTNASTGSILSEGTYSCIISDSNSCNVTSYTTIINPPLITTDSTTKVDITCNGLTDGSATVLNPSGGTPFTPGNYYTYEWLDDSGTSIGQTTQTATGLSSGTYSCIVFDATSCSSTTSSVTIIDPPLLVIDSIAVNPITCFGECDASILSIQASGGTPSTTGYSYLYSVNGGLPHPNTSYFNNYCADTYTVEVRDANNCFNQEILIIDEPLQLDVSVTTSLWNNYQIRCNGDNSGFANIAVSGGSNPYIINYYELPNINPISISDSVGGLIAGIYTFEVIDSHGCDTTTTITYSQPAPITHNFIPTHVTCNAWSNGSLTDSVYGGVGNSSSYIYSWNTGDSTYSLLGIPTGTYTISVTDENNCNSQDSYVINDNNALSASAIVTNVSCFDYCDGEITANVVGGVPSIGSNGNTIYNYQWNDTLLQTTQTSVGLCVDNNMLATTYECVITDMQGCTVTLSETVTQNPELTVVASVDDAILCFNGTGDLDAIADGGSNVYQYMWNNDAPNYSTISSNNNVTEGDYVITVKDSEGCIAFDLITLTEPLELSLTISEYSVSCYGFNDGKIIATATGGTPFLGIPPKYLYSAINDVTGATIYSSTSAVGLAENLTPGIYIIEVEDDNSCVIESGTIYISEPGDSLSIMFNTVDASCLQANGSASVVVYGGTPSYQYNWDNNTTTANNVNLQAGYYPITVIDSRGCEIRDSAFVKGTHNVFADSLAEITFNICLGDSVFIEINETPFNTYVWDNGSVVTDRWVYPTDYLNIYTLTIFDPSCSSSYDVTATVNAEFVNPMLASNPAVEYGNYPIVLAGQNIELYSENDACVEYTWQWSQDTIINTNGSITIMDVEETDWYYLYVKDVEGCLGYDSIYVVVGVLPYEAITPNNDGFNDTWTPLDIESYENALVQVFNRWGGLVFESKGGENYQAWDGTNDGEDLVSGTYYYIIDLDTGDEPQTGPITIIR